ncbi:hypothetical protein BLL38_25370 [Pseudomonas gessardii]|nr:hypothetical protein BLL38_25370 [Pseudomonas gessardii]
MRMERSKLTDDRLEGDERGSELVQGSDLRMDPRVLLAFRANRGQAHSHILTVFTDQMWEWACPR